MNKKIEELAWGHGLYDAPSEEIEKFALAIIQECIKIVQPTAEHRKDASWGYIAGEEGVELLDAIVEKLRNHFGVSNDE